VKTVKNPVDDDPLDHEIDFIKSRPNPYWLGTVDRRCVRLIASDLAEAFPMTRRSMKPCERSFEGRRKS